MEFSQLPILRRTHPRRVSSHRQVLRAYLHLEQRQRAKVDDCHRLGQNVHRQELLAVFRRRQLDR